MFLLQVVIIDGYIDGVGAGFRGGVTSALPGEGGRQGESYVGGVGDISSTGNRGGGGGGRGGNRHIDGSARSGGGGGYANKGYAFIAFTF